MLSTGAYSKKYQQLEKEKAKDSHHKARKAARDRAQALSRQTAQRQKAMEEKKRAMAAAEEERRKRALEERRKAQQEATERFKTAICRLKTTSRGQSAPARSREVHVEFYLPDKPKAGVKPDSRREGSSRKERRPRERVAVGREVEIPTRREPPTPGLQRRTPSLDDVLRSIRDQSTPRNDSHSRDSTTSHASAPNQHGTPVNRTLQDRSASDPNIVIPVYQVASKDGGTSDQPACTCLNATHTSLSSTTSSNDQSQCGPETIAEDTKAADQVEEKVVFHPVTRAFHPIPSSPSPSDDIRVMSPEIPDSCSSLSDSLSNSDTSIALHDSLSSSPVNAKLPTKRHTREYGNAATVSLVKHPPQPYTLSSSQSQKKSGIRKPEDSDSSSSGEESYPAHRPTPPRPRRQARHSSGRTTTNCTMEKTVTLQQTSEEAAQWASSATNPLESRLIGILKKPGSVSQTPQSSSAASTTCPSRVTSAARSVVMDGFQSYSSSTMSEGSKLPKRVRFVDQVGSPSRFRSGTRESPVIAVLHPNLWKTVLPNGFSARFPPNSAFAPKMKVSLSSRPTFRKPPPTPPNGIVVHVPRATIDISPTKGSPSCESVGGETEGQNPKLENSSLDFNSSSPTHKVKNQHKRNVSDGEEPGPTPQFHIYQGGGQELFSVATERDFGPSHSQQAPQVSFGEPPDEAPTARRQIPLDKTPTDDDINELWDQIRTCLQEDKVVLPPHVYRLLTEDHNPMSPKRENQRAALTTRQHPPSQRPRQPNRPLRCQNELHHPVQLWKRQSHAHHRPHPHAQPSPRDPQFAGGLTGRKAPVTTLSLEEQRLMQSIEKLNQRLRDHLAMKERQELSSPELDAYDQSPRPPTPPKGHPPPTVRMRGPSDLPKTRVRRHPKTIAMAAAMNSQALDSRTRHRIPVHRQPFYNV